MKTFAVIDNNIVSNLILAETLEDAQSSNKDKICVEYTIEEQAHIGLGYNNGVFEQPIFEEVPPMENPEQYLTQG